MVLWGLQGPKGLLTGLTTVGATRAWRKYRQRKSCKKDRRRANDEKGPNEREANTRQCTEGKEGRESGIDQMDFTEQ